MASHRAFESSLLFGEFGTSAFGSEGASGAWISKEITQETDWIQAVGMCNFAAAYAPITCMLSASIHTLPLHGSVANIVRAIEITPSWLQKHTAPDHQTLFQFYKTYLWPE